MKTLQMNIKAIILDIAYECCGTGINQGELAEKQSQIIADRIEIDFDSLRNLIREGMCDGEIGSFEIAEEIIKADIIRIKEKV